MNFKKFAWMREAMFIKKNAEKWQQYQHQQTDNPDEIAERFVTLVDDLAYAKTFYPKSKVTRWINGIAANIYQNIYQNRKEKYTRILSFWKYELPLMFKRYHKILFFTSFVFLLFVVIGYWSSIKNPEFLEGILGEKYVKDTEENIANGDPFGVYKDDNPFSTFIWIAINNISISFLAALGGFLLGIPTLFGWKFAAGLLQTGVMLGSFHQFFFKYGLGAESILVIWIHGILEITMIVISATAGFVIANGILFPKTYSRIVSFKQGVKDAVKILLVVVPLLITAAFFEIYITHLMSQTFDKEKNFGLPIWAGVLILVTITLFLAWYFIIYPIRLHKKGYTIQPNGIIHRLNNTHE